MCCKEDCSLPFSTYLLKIFLLISCMVCDCFYCSSVQCLELGDYQTASKLALLEKQFDMAMSYQLQAALANSEIHKRPSSVSSSQPTVWEKASKPLVKTEVIVPTLEARLTVNVSSNAAKKLGISRTKSNLAEVNGAETSDSKEPAKSVEKPAEEAEEKSTSEIHTFEVQGGAEEMSTRSQDTLCTRSDLVESRCDTPDTLASSGCEDFVTRSAEVFDSPVKHCVKTKCSAISSLAYESIVSKHIKDLEQYSAEDLDGSLNDGLLEDLVHIVEFYIDLCEQGPQTSLKALLKQVIPSYAQPLESYTVESLIYVTSAFPNPQI